MCVCVCVRERKGETKRYVEVKKWEAIYRASDEGEERTLMFNHCNDNGV